MSLFQVKAEIAATAAESVDELFLEHEEANWSVLQDVLVQRAWVVGIFDSQDRATAAWQQIQPILGAAGAAPGQPDLSEMGDEDWRDSYKAHFKASTFGRLHWVPVWERDSHALPAGDLAIWLDPGLAFGTGNHETTRLCCHRLVEWASAHGTTGRVIDAGCGSGILALSAARLGFTQVAGFDNDPEAIRVSEENAALNDLVGAVELYEGDLMTGFENREAELVLANILGHILVKFKAQLLSAVAPGGTLVLSGILASERDEVRDAFAESAPDWDIDSRIDGEWADVV
ncbi:MAG: 50S ribosomal protein L11 methyltransferase, partial [Verrucomicrobiota bacterium]